MRRHGYIPDAPDYEGRDHKFSVSWFSKAKYMPESMLRPTDLESQCPEPFDQLSAGSCVWNATTAAMRYDYINNVDTDVPLSRLQGYFDTRAMEGSQSEDSGCQIRDALKIAATIGVAEEAWWPYDLTKLYDKPDAAAYASAAKHRAVEYQRVDVSARAIKTALYTGRPVIIGVQIFPSFESDEVAKSGVVPMPAWNERSIGGHAMLVIGFGQRPGFFKVRNSWSSAWGDGGNAWIPEEYVVKYGNDFWCVYSNT